MTSGLSQITWMPASMKALDTREMQMIGRHDRHRLDAIVAFGFRFAISRKSL